MQTNAPNPHVGEAIDSLGGDSAVAARAGLKTAWAVSKWRRALPVDRALWLAEQTEWKFTPHMLAPTIYPNARDGIPPGTRLPKEAV
jgi:DNA-binding transcriptional regulator YdaS (Cro superfamily)